MNNSPCYKCENRKLGCHDKCVDYFSWKINQNAKITNPEQKKDADFVDYKILRSIKLTKAHKMRMVIGEK